MSEEKIPPLCIEEINSKPCFMCGKPGKFIDVCSEQHFCSEKCLDKFYDWYESVVRQSKGDWE